METFTLRYGWLKKVVDAIQAVESSATIDSSNNIHDSRIIADFGVGKNMVQSMRHWALSTGILSFAKLG